MRVQCTNNLNRPAGSGRTSAIAVNGESSADWNDAKSGWPPKIAETIGVHGMPRWWTLSECPAREPDCLSQSRYAADSFSVEHILPRCRGGTDAEFNLALACQGCNNRKFVSVVAADPLTGRAVPLYHPRQDRDSLRCFVADPSPYPDT